MAGIMDVFTNIGMGFSVAVTLMNLFYCFVGVTLGTLIGVLPGIGPMATIAMLLPMTFSLPPTSAMIMLAGIYYGAQYGGSTTAIMVNLPGEASSIVTCLDGYAMARNGRPGPALSVAAIASFVAGCVSTLCVAFFAPVLAELGLNFGPVEYVSLMVLGLTCVALLRRGSLLKALAMTLLGLLMGSIGIDINTGMCRLTFGIPELSEGIHIVILAVGLFALGEIIVNLEVKEKREVLRYELRTLMPTRTDMMISWKPILRGSGLGSILGILPGGTAVLSSFASYALEKRLAVDPSRFGKGAIEGVAGPESANNAAAQTSFIPMLTLGLPSNGVMALMLGAMTIQGICPGPQVLTGRPDLFWGLVASMWIGNFMLLVLNLPLVGLWVRLLTIPYRLLYPAILLFCCIGVYTLNNSVIDVLLMAVFGLLGYIFIKLDCEPAPLVMGFILGPMMEENLRRGMELSRGDPTVFFTRPISLALLLLEVILVLLLCIPAVSRKRLR